MERVLPGEQLHRKQLGQRRVRITAVGERLPPAQEQDAAAAPVGELADQVLLRRVEIAGLHVPYNQTREREQFLRFSREAILQLLHIVEALTVNLVLRCPENRGQLNAVIVLHRSANE